MGYVNVEVTPMVRLKHYPFMLLKGKVPASSVEIGLKRSK